ncbi:MAG: hypothetical protein ACPGR8_09985 [Limisphaerales bacterium]
MASRAEWGGKKGLVLGSGDTRSKIYGAFWYSVEPKIVCELPNNQILPGVPFGVGKSRVVVVQVYGKIPDSRGKHAESYVFTAVVRISEENPEKEENPHPFYRYEENLPGRENGVLAGAAGKIAGADYYQYSYAPKIGTEALTLTGNGLSVTRIEPESVNFGYERGLLGKVAPTKGQRRVFTEENGGEKLMSLWYPVVLFKNFKMKTVDGLDSMMRTRFGCMALKQWMKMAGITRESIARGGLEDIVAKCAVPINGKFATYTPEVANQWFCAAEAYAVCGRRVWGDCEDMALSVFGFFKSLREPGIIAELVKKGLIDPSRSRDIEKRLMGLEPGIASGFYTFPAGHSRAGTREAHMWAFVVDTTDTHSDPQVYLPGREDGGSSGKKIGRFMSIESVLGDTKGKEAYLPKDESYEMVRIFTSNSVYWTAEGPGSKAKMGVNLGNAARDGGGGGIHLRMDDIFRSERVCPLGYPNLGDQEQRNGSVPLIFIKTLSADWSPEDTRHQDTDTRDPDEDMREEACGCGAGLDSEDTDNLSTERLGIQVPVSAGSRLASVDHREIPPTRLF